MGDPEARSLRQNMQDQPWLGRIVLKRFDMLPCTAVVADHRRSVFSNRAAVGLIIVLAREVDDVERQFSAAGVIDAEVIPVSLPITPILILLPFRREPKVGLGDFLDAAKAPGLEIRAHRSGRGDRRNQEDQPAHGQDGSTPDANRGR